MVYKDDYTMATVRKTFMDQGTPERDKIEDSDDETPEGIANRTTSRTPNLATMIARSKNHGTTVYHNSQPHSRSLSHQEKYLLPFLHQ
jgi:hypothetical protein